MIIKCTDYIFFEKIDTWLKPFGGETRFALSCCGSLHLQDNKGHSVFNKAPCPEPHAIPRVQKSRAWFCTQHAISRRGGCPQRAHVSCADIFLLCETKHRAPQTDPHFRCRKKLFASSCNARLNYAFYVCIFVKHVDTIHHKGLLLHLLIW